MAMPYSMSPLSASMPPPHVLTRATLVAFPRIHSVHRYDSAINNPDSFMTQAGFGAITRDGIRLTHHMAYLYCSPSRRSFLSGRFPNHINTAQAPICSNYLPLQFTLLPAKLKAAGYATHMVGKGHLGYMTTDHLPVNRGFDSHLGYLAHGEGYNWGNGGNAPSRGSHWQDFCVGSNVTNNLTRYCKKDMWHNKATGWDLVDHIAYSTNFYTRRAVDLIQAHDPKQPFYLHLTHQAVHNPWEEPPLSGQIPNGSAWWDQTWGSMLNVLDKGIANVTTALRAKGMWETTLVVLVSDNGGAPGASPSDPTGRTTMANNWPLRGTKLTPWEGGTRVAAVVGGGFVPLRLRGSSSDVLMHMADWYPTLANLAGAVATDPAVVNGSVHDVDGMDMWPAITGANASSPRPWLPTTGGTILWQQPDGTILKYLTDARRSRLFSPNGAATSTPLFFLLSRVGFGLPSTPLAPCDESSTMACSISYPCPLATDWCLQLSNVVTNLGLRSIRLDVERHDPTWLERDPCRGVRVGLANRPGHLRRLHSQQPLPL